MTTTKVEHLINPQVLADTVAGELAKKIRFAPFARLDTELEGQAGDTITRPRYAYVGPATDLTEGVPMDTSKLAMTTAKVTVKEAGKAIEVSEAAILTNVDGTMDEAGNQIGLAISDKVDIDYLETMGTTELALAQAPHTAGAIIDAITLFGDEDVEEYVLFIHTKDYTELRKSLISGNTHLTMDEIADLLDLSAIVRTNRVEEGTAFVQKQGAVEIVYKKQPEIKTAEDILARTVVMAGNTFYATNLYNEAGVVKVAAI